MARGGRLDVGRLRADLKAGRIAGVYFLCGEEAFLKEEAAATLRSAVLGNGEGGTAWNLTVLEGGNAALAEILDEARTLPMLGSRRLVLVKETERLRDTDSEPLKAYLKNPTPTSCLLFITGTGGKPDLRKGIFRALMEGASVLEFKTPRGPAVLKWIRERAAQRGAQIDEEAAALLEVHRGADLLRIDQELAKVIDFVAPSRQVTAEALAETIGAAVAGSVFELAERVGSGDTAEAIRLLRGILADGEEPARLLFLVARQIRLLVLGKALAKAGQRGRSLAMALGIPPIPPIIEKTESLVARFPESAGAPSLKRILEADRALKGGMGKGPAILEGLILDLTFLVRRLGREEARA